MSDVTRGIVFNLGAKDDATAIMTRVNKSILTLAQSVDTHARVTAGSMRGMSVGTVAAGTLIAGVIERVASAAWSAAKMMATWTDQVIANGNASQRLADQLHMPTTQLMALQHVTKDINDSDVGQFDDAMKKLTKSIGQAADSGGPAADALEQIGLNIKSVAAMRPDEQFYAIADGIARIRNPSVQAAAAVALFGKSGQEMIPVLNKGSAELRKMADQQIEFGTALSRMDTSKLAEIDDRFDEIGNRVEGMKNRIVLAAAPEIIRAGNIVLDFFTQFTQHIETEVEKAQRKIEARNLAAPMVMNFEEAKITISGIIDDIRKQIDTIKFPDVQSKIGDVTARNQQDLEEAKKYVQMIADANNMKIDDVLQPGWIDSYKADLQATQNEIDRLDLKIANAADLHRQTWQKEARDRYQYWVDEYTRQKNEVVAQASELQGQLNTINRYLQLRVKIDVDGKGLETIRQVSDELQQLQERRAAKETYNAATRQMATLGMKEAEVKIFDLTQRRAELLQKMQAMMGEAMQPITLNGLPELQQRLELLKRIGNIAITIDMDSAALDKLREVQKAIADNQNSDEMKKWAQSIIESTRTPVEKTRAEVERVQEAMRAGLFADNPEAATRYLEKLRNDLQAGIEMEAPRVEFRLVESVGGKFSSGIAQAAREQAAAFNPMLDVQRQGVDVLVSIDETMRELAAKGSQTAEAPGNQGSRPGATNSAASGLGMANDLVARYGDRLTAITGTFHDGIARGNSEAARAGRIQLQAMQGAWNGIVTRNAQGADDLIARYGTQLGAAAGTFNDAIARAKGNAVGSSPSTLRSIDGAIAVWVVNGGQAENGLSIPKVGPVGPMNEPTPNQIDAAGGGRQFISGAYGMAREMLKTFADAMQTAAESAPIAGSLKSLADRLFSGLQFNAPAGSITGNPLGQRPPNGQDTISAFSGRLESLLSPQAGIEGKSGNRIAEDTREMVALLSAAVNLLRDMPKALKDGRNRVALTV